MSFSLERSGYVLDTNVGVWRKPTYEGIAYSDGDAVETRIGATVANATDVSLGSAELVKSMSDWPSLYHLSGTRANILRPFHSRLEAARVLEIGAGCGAITRYLGESGAQVLALEGSPRRAAIVRSRCRDLSDVTVVSERFDDFVTEERFDVVTLIGVLEYASLFTPGSAPALAMLSRVRDLLSPGGIVIVAIENQVGLKYFAGAPEDHVGIPMFGIENRYAEKGPRTYGRAELAQLFRQASFEFPSFMAPFPDYKFPVAVVTEAGFAHPGFDPSALAVQTVHQDPQLAEHPSFTLQRVWPTVIRNDLGMDVANSFIVVAEREAREQPRQDVLAFYYNTARRSPFCKEVLFRPTVDAIVVESRAIETRSSGLGSLGRYRFVLEDVGPYVAGRLLSDSFVDVVSKNGWTLEDVGDYLRRYVGILADLSRTQGRQSVLDSAHAALPGAFLDLIPQNIVIGEDGRARPIDMEWQQEDSIELGFLLFRAILSLVNRNFSFSPQSRVALMSRREFLQDASRAAGIPIGDTDFDRYARQESAFQNFATGREVSDFLDRWADEPLPLSSAPNSRFVATVYHAHPDATFSDDQIVVQKVSSGSADVVLVLPPDATTPSMLRIDPADRAGWYEITRIELFDAAQEHQWSCAFEQDYVVSPSIAVFGAARPGKGLLLHAGDDDPQMLPVLPSGLAARVGAGWRLELTVRLVDPAEVAHMLGERFEAVSDSARKAQAALEASAAERIASARTLRDLREQLAKSERRIAELEAGSANRKIESKSEGME
ncbi:MULTISPECIES: class I SAM-dependent methyltransferase [unclassified Caballeronia]|uniref:class I SAM-dependent methyltransferase n=1 Tax=unclassified Caballeronia TaxID=2646786 RepID=UPI0028659986|nr:MULTISPECIES: class I SAM-dependent methyltransferase [unclassified Caballeronia]MDR5751447.1 class I SAM-dependent methyltransferase [Caballeronia sp. LZ024]MDR5844412.1 class I SAM-dependent methyltransferase [Caballeronia sp. LZ031]